MTTLNIRIDEKIKKDARKTFARMGLDMSSAIKLFLYQTVGGQKISTMNDIERSAKNFLTIASESSLSKDWLSREEEKTWQNL